MCARFYTGQVVKRLQRHPGLKDAVDINDMIEIYDSSVRYAEKLAHDESETAPFAAAADAETRGVCIYILFIGIK